MSIRRSSLPFKAQNGYLLGRVICQDKGIIADIIYHFICIKTCKAIDIGQHRIPVPAAAVMHGYYDARLYGIAYPFGHGGINGIITAHRNKEKVASGQPFCLSLREHVPQIAQMNDGMIPGLYDVHKVISPLCTAAVVMEGIHPLDLKGQLPLMGNDLYRLPITVVAVFMAAKDQLGPLVKLGIAVDMVIRIDHQRRSVIFQLEAGMPQPFYL